MKKNKLKSVFVFFFAALFVFVLSSCGTFEGNVASVQIGSYTYDAYVFDNLDQLKASLKYIEDDLYGDIRLGSFDEEFDEGKASLTWDDDSTASKPVYSAVGKKVVAMRKEIHHTVSSTNYGYYTYVTYTATGGIRIFVYDDTKGYYSEPWDFDFGCDVD